MELRKTLQKKFLNEETFTEIKGQGQAKHQLKSALMMGRHVLIIGPPGIGKTTIAKNIAKLLPEIKVNDCPYNCEFGNPACPLCKTKKDVKTRNAKGDERFIRLQGSPDLTTEDLLGDIDPIKALKFGPSSIEAFTPGKILRANNGVLFFDEVNRCPEKLQNALLQVLEEGKATLGGYTIDLPANFIFIGTMNPEETTATERLSDVFLDRFDTIHMTYPETIETEVQIVQESGEKIDIEFPKKLLVQALNFIRILRENKDVIKKPSVRASLGLYERAQANAFLEREKKVKSRHITEALISVLAHRIELKPSIKYQQTNEEYIKKQYEDYQKDNPEMRGVSL